MTLTKRRKEFLAEVVRAHDDSDDPVHHHQVADALGVSNATSYDMLRALEGAGFLEREYLPTGGRGRSQVVYRPSAQAAALFDSTAARAPSMNEQDWLRASRAIKLEFQSFGSTTTGESATRLAMFVGAAEAQVELCAGVLALFALQMRLLPPQQSASVRYLCEAAPTGAPRLDSFVACLWGTTLTGTAPALSPQAGRLVALFLRTVDELTREDIDRLLSLLDYLLGVLPSEGHATND